MEASILELGTREFHLLHASLGGDGRVVPLAETKERVGLDASIDRTGRIGRKSWGDGLRAFGRLTTTAQRSNRTGEIVGIAPRELGGAENAEHFVHAARLRHGLAVDLLSSEESALLVFDGARHALGLGGALTVACLGDSTIELVSGSEAGAACQASLDMGVALVHLAYREGNLRLSPDDAPAVFSLVRLRGGPIGRRLAALGGRFVVCSDHALAVRDVARAWGFLDQDGAVIGRLALHALVPEVLGAAPASLARLGLPAEAAQLVGTAAVLVDALADLLGQREVHFSASSARYGAAVRYLTGSEGHAVETDASGRRGAGEPPRRYLPFTRR